MVSILTLGTFRHVVKQPHHKPYEPILYACRMSLDRGAFWQVGTDIPPVCRKWAQSLTVNEPWVRSSPDRLSPGNFETTIADDYVSKFYVCAQPSQFILWLNIKNKFDSFSASHSLHLNSNQRSERTLLPSNKSSSVFFYSVIPSLSRNCFLET